MKKILTLFGLLFVSLMMVSVASAEEEELSRYPISVTLDGGDSWACTSGDSKYCDSDDGESVTVAPGATIEVVYTVKGTHSSDWKCNEWEVVDGSSSGEDDFEPDYTNSNFGFETETFSITAPSSIGTYDLKLNARSSDDCDDGTSGRITLESAIIVAVEEDPSCEITVNPPVAGEYYNDSIAIKWSLGDDCNSPTYNLHFNVDTCTPQNPTDWSEIIDSVNALDYDWTSGIDEGEYCVRVSEDEGSDFGVSGLFYIDNIDPVADANGPYACNEGGNANLDATASTDNYLTLSYAWDFDGDGYYNDSYVAEPSYTCVDGPGLEVVSVKVTDLAGNTDTDDADVVVANVAPVCDGIEGPTEVPLINGEADATFSGSATDVDADMSKLEFNWNFGDTGSASDENPTTHTYTVAGNYKVLLSVDDTDGGVSEPTPDCMHMIQVIDPVQLADQEVAAFYPLVTDFGSDNGNAPNEFMHDVGSPDDCDMIIGPDNLRVHDYGGQDTCTVRWDRGDVANPTNAERGNHFVLVRIYNEDNASDVNYYSFNVMVYSWIIPLEEQWSLMSIPLTAEDSKSTAVFDYTGVGTEIEQIWSYEYDSDTDTSEWVCVKPTSSVGSVCGSGIAKLTNVNPGKAYWVKLKDDVESAVVKGMGISPNEIQGPMLPPATDVPTNAWSLVGRYGIVGENYNPTQSDDRRVHGWLPEDVALDSLTKIDNDMHLYDELFAMVNKLYNNEGYWLWIEDNAMNNAGFESYAPIDPMYPENSGETILNN